MGTEPDDESDTIYVVVRRVVRALPFSADEARALESATEDLEWELF